MTEEYRCSFCGAPRSSVNRLVRSPLGVLICDKCIFDAAHLMIFNGQSESVDRDGSGEHEKTVWVREDRLVRHMANMSGKPQTQLSHDMGKSRSYVTAMTSRGSSPSAANLAKLAKACGYELVLKGHGERILVTERKDPDVDKD